MKSQQDLLMDWELESSQEEFLQFGFVQLGGTQATIQKSKKIKTSGLQTC